MIRVIDISIGVMEISIRVTEVSIRVIEDSIEVIDISVEVIEVSIEVIEVSIEVIDSSIRVIESFLGVAGRQDSGPIDCSCSFTERQRKKDIDMADEVIVPNPHAEGAKALAEKIRALIADIPRLTLPGPNDAQRLAVAASVSEEFLESARAVMQKSALLESASGTNATTMRDASAFAMAYEAVLPEAEALMRLLAHTIRVAKAAAGESALDVYAISQRLAKRKNGAELVPHVKDMRRKLKRGHRKATSQPAPDKSVKPAPKS